MKNIFSIFFLCIVCCAPLRAQQTTYELEWATYLPTPAILGNRCTILPVDKNGNTLFYFYENSNPPNPTDFDAWLTDDAYYGAGYDSGHFLIQIDANQNHVYGSYTESFLPPHINLIRSSGETFWVSESAVEAEIGTSGAHQEFYSGNTHTAVTVLPDGTELETTTGAFDGIIIKYDSNHQKEWGTYLSGDNQHTYVNHSWLYNNTLYFSGASGATSGLTTPNAALPNPLLTNDAVLDYFIGAMDMDGNLLWLTYTHQKHVSPIIDSNGNIYGATHLKINVFNNQGEFVEDYDRPADVEKMYISPDDKIYFLGETSLSEGIATAGAFKTTKTANTEAFVLCYDLNFNKLWGTYLGQIETDDYYYYENPTRTLEHITFDENNHITVGFPTTTSGMAEETAHQTGIAGESDFFIINLDDTGNRVWSTYFGGEEKETYINTISYDQDNNLYIGGRTHSQTGIATAGALIEDAQVPVNGQHGGPFLAKFVPRKSSSANDFEKKLFNIYPNPTTDVLNITSTSTDNIT
ncbi:SBBP repeat-containing protein, partial [Avrilella dinanensis]|uniref:SBBP repeat-containing protein n=1 Tax=Avrilella dinanensis TaxID=2008672 RepID=UPI00240992FF